MPNRILYHILTPERDSLPFLDVVVKMNGEYQDVKTPGSPIYGINGCEVEVIIQKSHTRIAIKAEDQDEAFRTKSQIENRLDVILELVRNGN